MSRMLGVFDAGQIINDKAARSQLMGGMIWGISAALHEASRSRRTAGSRTATSRATCSVNADIPEVDVHFVEYPDTLHNAVGARGLGEIGTVGMAAARRQHRVQRDRHPGRHPDHHRGSARRLTGPARAAEMPAEGQGAGERPALRHAELRVLPTIGHLADRRPVPLPIRDSDDDLRR